MPKQTEKGKSLIFQTCHLTPVCFSSRQLRRFDLGTHCSNRQSCRPENLYGWLERKSAKYKSKRIPRGFRTTVCTCMVPVYSIFKICQTVYLRNRQSECIFKPNETSKKQSVQKTDIGSIFKISMYQVIVYTTKQTDGLSQYILDCQFSKNVDSLLSLF